MKRVCRLLVLCCLAGQVWAQFEQPKQPDTEFVRLDFALKDLDSGKTVNTRTYFTIVPIGQSGQNERESSIRSGDKVAIQQGTGFSYIDVGVNIDVRAVRRVGETLTFSASADITGAVDLSDAGSHPGGPMLRQLRWSSQVVVPLRKATVVFASDGAASKRQVQLEITATPIKY